MADVLDLAELADTTTTAAVATSSPAGRTLASLGGAGGATPFRIASLTKPVTAVATVRACRRAGVDLDTPLAVVLGSDAPAAARTTVAHVLSQTSGLAASVTAEDVRLLGDGDDALATAAALVLRAGHARPAGERWEYYNGNYFVAGAVLAAVTGTTYEEALREHVLDPWELTSTTFEPPADLVRGQDAGQPAAAAPYPRGRRPSGGLCSTADDLLTFAERLLADDARSAGVLAEVATARTAVDDRMRYGLGWALGPSGQLFLNGRLPGTRAALVLVPEHRLAAVGLAAASEALPGLARLLSDAQADLTGDDLARAIDAFAA